MPYTSKKTDLPWYRDANEVNGYRKRALRLYRQSVKALRAIVEKRDYSLSGEMEFISARNETKRLFENLIEMQVIHQNYINSERRKAMREADESEFGQ